MVHTKIRDTRTSAALVPHVGPLALSTGQNRTPVRRRLLALLCVSACFLTACGVLPGTGPDRRTVTVWLMKDSASQEFLDRFTEDFEHGHPDLDLDIRIQEWTGIGGKVEPRWRPTTGTGRTSSRSATPRSRSTSTAADCST